MAGLAACVAEGSSARPQLWLSASEQQAADHFVAGSVEGQSGRGGRDPGRTAVALPGLPNGDGNRQDAAVAALLGRTAAAPRDPGGEVNP